MRFILYVGNLTFCCQKDMPEITISLSGIYRSVLELDLEPKYLPDLSERLRALGDPPITLFLHRFFFIASGLLFSLLVLF